MFPSSQRSLRLWGWHHLSEDVLVTMQGLHHVLLCLPKCVALVAYLFMLVTIKIFKTDIGTNFIRMVTMKNFPS